MVEPKQAAHKARAIKRPEKPGVDQKREIAALKRGLRAIAPISAERAELKA
jgi:hypothetical protein